MSGSDETGNPDPEAARQRDRRGRGDRRGNPAVSDHPREQADVLIAVATDARRFAQARYSGFQVGAALETVEGQLVTGCNIENATYGLTLCAERVALVKALSDGHTAFTRIVVVADTETLTPPCGPCRQLLWEYAGDLEVILANLRGASAVHRLSALLPLPFDARLLG